MANTGGIGKAGPGPSPSSEWGPPSGWWGARASHASEGVTCRWAGTEGNSGGWL